ncbi:hypothetical protein DRQ53_04105 [bacterium]|nr:MAG: hypothetical protein DRQ32_02525 [bacterium]RKZ17234.1 MAG: hypothetical protein DRQ53_04105 [bacterium]
MHRYLILIMLCLASLPMLASASQDVEREVDIDDVMVELTEALVLTPEQVPQVEQALQSYLLEMDETQARYEEMEEPDPQDMLGDLKQVRENYYERMQEALTPDQWTAYEELREEILHEIFSEIAALRIIDLKTPLSLTEGQMAAMKPVMGSSLREVIRVVFQYGDKRLGIRNKLKIANALKSTKAKQDEAMAGILSESQIAAWDALKEEQKAQK